MEVVVHIYYPAKTEGIDRLKGHISNRISEILPKAPVKFQETPLIEGDIIPKELRSDDEPRIVLWVSVESPLVEELVDFNYKLLDKIGKSLANIYGWPLMVGIPRYITKWYGKL